MKNRFFILLISVIVSINVNGQYGFLNRGRLYNLSTSSSEPLAVGFQSDGKILTLSNPSTAFHGDDIGLIRFNSNLKTDVSFEGKNPLQPKGTIYYSVSDKVEAYENEEAIGFEIDSLDNILIAGNYKDKLLFFKLNADGSYDSTYSNKGKLVLQLFNTGVNIGKLIGFGQSRDNTVYALTKPEVSKNILYGFTLSNSGIVIGGPKKIVFKEEIYSITKIHFNARDKKFYILARFGTSDNLTTKLMKMDHQFNIDTSFGNNGFIERKELTKGIKIMSDGKIVFSQNTKIGNNDAPQILKMDEKGSIDSTFAVNGVFTLKAYASLNIHVSDILIDEENQIIVGGNFNRNKGATSKDSIVLFQLDKDGNFVKEFGKSGIITNSFFGKTSNLSFLGMNVNGEIICNGKTIPTVGIIIDCNIFAYMPCSSRRILFKDKDKDGYGSNNDVIYSCKDTIVGYVYSNNDCNDDDWQIHPGSEEIPENDVDENCDGIIGIIDNDGDGYGISTDCDDSNAAINPGQLEIINNMVDEDCDGFIYIDFDNDGFTIEDDCNDMDSLINPIQQDTTMNGIDENCDGIDGIVSVQNFDHYIHSFFVVNNILNVHFINKRPRVIKIVDILGRVIVNLESNDTVLMFPLESMPVGIYYLIVFENSVKVATKALMVSNN